MTRKFDPRPGHPAVPALISLHSMLGGKMLENRKQQKQIAADMKHVEAVIRMFAPHYDVTAIAARRRRRSNPYFSRGTVFREALNILREADGPLTTREICIRLLATKEMADPPLKVLRDLIGAVQSSLRNHKGGTVQAIGEGMPGRWKLSGDRD